MGALYEILWLSPQKHGVTILNNWICCVITALKMFYRSKVLLIYISDRSTF